jgi:hypothetical protein
MILVSFENFYIAFSSYSDEGAADKVNLFSKFCKREKFGIKIINEWNQSSERVSIISNFKHM